MLSRRKRRRSGRLLQRSPSGVRPVRVGPFEDAPTGLWPVVLFGPGDDGRIVAPDEIRARTAAWLAARLGEAGVTLGRFDVELVAELATDWPRAQVIAGWVVRARGGEPS